MLAIAIGVLLLGREHRLPGQKPVSPRLALRILPFAADTTDSMVTAYRQRLFGQLSDDARAEPLWDLVAPSAPGATHTLSGSLVRDQHTMKIFVRLVDVGDKRTIWADDVVDLYAFSGNSKMSADRIEKAVARILGDSTARGRSATR